MTTSVSDSASVGADEQAMSPFRRMIAVYAHPAGAWAGLERKAQWWFPVLVYLLFVAAFTLVLHERAFLPMMTAAWEEQVANGQLSGEQFATMERFFSGPGGLAVLLGQQLVITPIMIFLIAAVIAFGVGFVLGTRLRYRLALEVAAWATLIWIPGQILFGVLAWTQGTMRNIHIGFGALIPESDSKLMNAVAQVLDALGPLSLWYLVVAVLGAAALSGAKRASVTWVLGTLYLVIVVFLAALGTVLPSA